MAKINRLAPEKIIKKKHATAAFRYIRKHGQQEGDIRYYKIRPDVEKASVVEFKGEKYYHWQTLKLAQLFALKDAGKIKDEKPPFPVAYEKHICGILLERDDAKRIWKNMGFTPRRNIYVADGEDSNKIVKDGYELLKQFRQIIFHGPPGTGKTYSAQKVLESLFKVDEEKLRGMQRKRWDIVQFHSSYNYEDFVRGIKVGVNGKQIKYKIEDRVFGKMCKRAKGDKSNDYALIIDEINRVNVSSVLGELIYALEYRGKSVETLYAISEGERENAELIIPENLYIIGTMNNADRTVGQIDYAVRRRFVFLRCLPDESVIKNKAKEIKVALKFFHKVNDIFIKHLSPDFQADDVRIGHSYFLDEKTKFANRIIYQVVPMLEEYLTDGILETTAADIIKQICREAKDVKKAMKTTKKAVAKKVKRGKR